MKCKQCKINDAKKGNFCSVECRQQYWVNYRKEHRKIVLTENKDDRDTGNAYRERKNPLKSIPKNTDSRLSRDYSGYGDYEWYKIAKKFCANFNLRETEGICAELFGQQRVFKNKCSECNIGKMIKQNIGRFDRMEKGEGIGCKLKSY